MSYLLADGFNDSVPIESSFTIQHKGALIGCIRVHCFKLGNIVNGSFTMTISQGGTDLGTATITATEIDAINATHAHGMFTWTFGNGIFLGVNDTDDEQTYDIRFESSGYTETGSSSFAVCKGFESVFVGEYGINYSTETPEQQACSRPYSLEFYIWDK